MTKAANKAISNEDIQEFHFAGTGSHAPVTIKAHDQSEAQEKYRELMGMKVMATGYESQPKSKEL